MKPKRLTSRSKRMFARSGEPMKDFNPRDFPQSRNAWIKPEEFAEFATMEGTSNVRS